jgi:sulfide:quinone oxidoreductase
MDVSAKGAQSTIFRDQAENWDCLPGNATVNRINSSNFLRSEPILMMRVVHLTPDFAVASQLAASDFASLAAQGFKSILANRPDGEDPSQLSETQSRTAAEAAGLVFRFLPLHMADVLEPATAAATRDALNSMPGPILAFCRSGTRSAIAWAAAATQVAPVESVIDALERADFAIPGIADELRARAAQQR